MSQHFWKDPYGHDKCIVIESDTELRIEISDDDEPHPRKHARDVKKLLYILNKYWDEVTV